jgi:HEAT repeat protein
MRVLEAGSGRARPHRAGISRLARTTIPSIVLLVASHAPAAVIHLTNGGAMEARTWREVGDELEMVLDGGTMRIPRADVVRIEGSALPAPAASASPPPAARPAPGPSAKGSPGAVSPPPQLSAATVDGRTVDEWRRDLASPTVAVRRKAASALARLAGSGAGPGRSVLAPALKDADPEVRLTAAIAMATYRQEPQTVTAVLVSAFRASDVTLRRAGSMGLTMMGPAGRDAAPALLLAFAGDPDVIVRQNAAAALRQIGPASRDVVPGLSSALRHRDPEVRRAAARVLGDLGVAATPARPALVAATKNPDRDTRLLALRALAVVDWPTEIASPELLQALSDPDPHARLAAAWGVLRTEPGNHVAVTTLVRTMRDASLEDRHVAEVLPAARDPEFSDMVRALQDKDPRRRRWGARAPMPYHPWPPELAAALTKALEDPDGGVRTTAAVTLLNATPAIPEGTAVLDDALDDPDARIRQRAVVGLLDMSARPPAAVAMLSRALTDAHPSVRQAAALALMRTRDAAPDAVPAVVRALEDPDELVRAAAVMALGAAPRRARAPCGTFRAWSRPTLRIARSPSGRSRRSRAGWAPSRLRPLLAGLAVILGEDQPRGSRSAKDARDPRDDEHAGRRIARTAGPGRYGFLRTALITEEPTGGRFTIAVSSLITPLRIACATVDGGRKPIRIARASSV